MRKKSKIKYSSIGEVNEMERYQVETQPYRQMTILKPIIWGISFTETYKRHLKINKINMEGLKRPYLLLSTHHAFVDFKVTTRAIFPHRASYVVALDGFINREGLLKHAGGIIKRKFTNDLVLVKQIKNIIEKNHDICVIYPEARYSLVGTNAILPDSLGKLCKFLQVPVVVLNIHGDYLSSPVWNLYKKNNRIEADMTQVVNQQEIQNLTVTEINDRINKAFIYDEYKWQKDHNISIDHPKRANGLHLPLYKCPVCGCETQMEGQDIFLTCHNCNSKWEMTELGELKGVAGTPTKFSHIPDWYEWERSEVRQSIDDGTYKYEGQAYVDSLPNASGYYRLGVANVKHDINGFEIRAKWDKDEFILKKDPLSTYSIHIEYQYLKKGNCFSLSTLNDTYYLFPVNQADSVTKLHFAAEEIYKKLNKQKGA